MATAAKKAAEAKPTNAPVDSEIYTCERCGAAFIVKGPGPHEVVTEHEEGRCPAMARTPLERARLLVNAQWEAAEDELPTDVTGTALLAIAEELHIANVVARESLTAAAKAKVDKALGA